MAAEKNLLADDKFYVYASNSGQSESDNTLVLPKDTPINTFVASLKDKVVILGRRPEADKATPFDSADDWAKWLGNLDEHGEYSMTVDPTAPEKDKAVQSFQFKFTAPWKLAFSSSADVLKSTFGDAAASIQLPGVVVKPDGPMLYCGLLQPEAPIKTTVEEVFKYVGLDRTVDNLPSIVSSLTLTLDQSNYAGKRNAMWSDPSFSLRTTLRLQFQLDAKDTLQELLSGPLPGFKISQADVVCKKILTAADMPDGRVGVDQGKILFQVACTVGAANGPTVGMEAGIEFKDSGISLTFNMKKDESILQAILIWLKDAVGVDLGSVTDLFGPQGRFDGINLRRMVFGLDTTQDPDKPRLSSFRLDIEAAANFGQDAGKKPVFLATYAWTRRGSKIGSIRGQLWTSYNSSKDRALQPSYEEWADIQPWTTNPGTVINLETLIPSETVEIPNTIPSKITRAFIVLSLDNFSLGATVEADKKVSPGPVPQPSLGLVRVDASYAWGNEKQFKFEIGVMAEIEPSSSSKHKDPAILKGDLSYTRSG